MDTPLPPEELCYSKKGKQAEQLQELQELNLVSCGDKNIKNFIAGDLKYNFSVWQKITSDRVILDTIKNSLKITSGIMVQELHLHPKFHIYYCYKFKSIFSK